MNSSYKGNLHQALTTIRGRDKWLETVGSVEA